MKREERKGRRERKRRLWVMTRILTLDLPYEKRRNTPAALIQVAIWGGLSLFLFSSPSCPVCRSALFCIHSLHFYFSRALSIFSQAAGWTSPERARKKERESCPIPSPIKSMTPRPEERREKRFSVGGDVAQVRPKSTTDEGVAAPHEEYTHDFHVDLLVDDSFEDVKHTPKEKIGKRKIILLSQTLMHGKHTIQPSVVIMSLVESYFNYDHKESSSGTIQF